MQDKILLPCIFSSILTNWYSFDECNTSSDESIDIFSWSPSGFSTGKSGYFTEDATSTYDGANCKKLIPTAKPFFLHIFGRVLDYVGVYFSEEGEIS